MIPRCRLGFGAAALAFLSTAALALCQAPGGGPAVWGQWRGPTRDGRVAPGGHPWPESIGEAALRLQWRVPLGNGYSSPIVSADRVFTVETEANEREVVRALDRATGKELWNTNWTGAMQVPFFARSRGSWVRCTPALGGDVLYVGGMRDVLACIDTASGRERWRVDFMERYQSTLPDFGFVSSPLVTADGIYVQAGGCVSKLNLADGQSLWRTLQDGGGMWHSAFSSPMLATLHGTLQLVVQTRNLLAGVDPGSGAVFWSVEVPAFRGMNILNPTVVGNQVFTSSYGGGSFLFDVTLGQGKWSVREVWKGGLEGYMSTPIVLNGFIYLHRRDRKFCCLEWGTGREMWVTQERFGQYWSLVSDGQRILALDQTGELLLLRPDPREFLLLERRRVSDRDTWAHLVVTDGQVFIRELNGIAAWVWE